MFNITPIGFERFPIPVNPIQAPRVQPVAPKPATRRTEPLAPIRAALGNNDGENDQKSRDSLERQYLLTTETRRSLLDLDPDHPLNGPHPTD